MAGPCGRRTDQVSSLLTWPGERRRAAGHLRVGPCLGPRTGLAAGVRGTFGRTQVRVQSGLRHLRFTPAHHALSAPAGVGDEGTCARATGDRRAKKGGRHMTARHWLGSLGLATCLAVMLLPAGTSSAQAQEADLSVEFVRGPRRVELGERLQYRVEITNHGPGVAHGVRVTASASDELEFIACSCRGTFNTPAECIVRDLRPDETVAVTFVLQAEESVRRVSRTARLSARVESRTFDPETDDNAVRRTLRLLDGLREDDLGEPPPTTVGGDGEEPGPLDVAPETRLPIEPHPGTEVPQLIEGHDGAAEAEPTGE
jgi:uncharacterized repeat protein (TIGR01451 family)